MARFSNSNFRERLFGFLLLFVLVSCLNAAPTEDGLYAEIQTSEGTFYAELAYDKAPITVANFVGLATGTLPWIDPTTAGVSNDPYFDGLLIPRAEPGFVIQMGSPTNTLSGGPGYRFQDEFHPDLNHDAAGILSMANSGPNTNGGQFFVTLDATPFLDRKHSVFGNVVEGLDVVTTIGGLPAGTVAIQQINILRIGTTATAFDATAWKLPRVAPVAIESIRVDKEQGSYTLEFSRNPFAQYTVNRSTDLSRWTAINDATLTQLFDTSMTTLNVSSVSTSEPKQFFRAAAANYNSMPERINRLTLTLNLIGSSETIVLNFTGEPRARIDYTNTLGSFSLNGETAVPVGAYLWIPNLPSGELVVAAEGIIPLRFYLTFGDDGTGMFTGASTASVAGTFPFYGDFTWSVSTP